MAGGDNANVVPNHIIFGDPPITLKFLHNNVTADNNTCIHWLQRQNLLSTAMVCTSCGNQCSYVTRNDVVDHFGWKCRVRNCRTRVGLRHGSFFAGHNLSLSTCLELLYWWCLDVPQHVVKQELDIRCDNTIVNWFKYARDVCTAYILDNHVPIGGANIIVEIDESKFMHRKYHRGAHVDGTWILGLVERDNPANCIMIPCPNNRRDADTLLPLIMHNVLPGTIIYTDMWRAYASLQQRGFLHGQVNHSVNFRDPVTGIHTNTIEGTWAHAKAKFRSMHGSTPEMQQSYLSHFVWRRKFVDNRFKHFIHQLTIYYPL